MLAVTYSISSCGTLIRGVSSSSQLLASGLGMFSASGVQTQYSTRLTLRRDAVVAARAVLREELRERPRLLEVVGPTKHHTSCTFPQWSCLLRELARA